MTSNFASDVLASSDATGKAASAAAEPSSGTRILLRLIGPRSATITATALQSIRQGNP
jgi:hypothetical protein